MNNIKDILGAQAYNLLLMENINSVQEFLMTDPKLLQHTMNTSKQGVEEALLIASKELLKLHLFTASDVETNNRISTGCKKLDELLKGGVAMNGIAELYGCSGVGKTQFCLQLAIHNQLSKNLRTQVIYICTEDVFPSKRLNQLAKAYREKFQVNIQFEDHIFLKHLTDCQELDKFFGTDLPHFLSATNVGLIIIDSIAGVFRSENNDYIARSDSFVKVCSALNDLQNEYKCAIFIVNQVTDNVDLGTSQPCLGLSWANNITHRYHLSRIGDHPVRTFEVVFSPELPPKSTNILITPIGLIDA